MAEPAIFVSTGNLLYGASPVSTPGLAVGQPVMSAAALLNALNYLTRAAAAAEPPGPLHGAVVHLYQNNVTPTDESLVTDFVECTFDGYGASTPVLWGTAYNDAADTCAVLGDNKQFTMTGAVTPNNVFGYFITTTAGVLIAAEAFDGPSGMSEAGEALVIVPRVALDQIGSLPAGGLVFSRPFLRTMLAYLTRASAVAEPAGPLHASTCDLYATSIAATPDNVLANFTLTAFTGYAQAGPAVFGAAFTNPDGSAEVRSQTLFFQATGAAVTGDARGYLTTAAGGNLQQSENFQSPVAFDETGKGLVLVLGAGLSNS